ERHRVFANNRCLLIDVTNCVAGHAQQAIESGLALIEILLCDRAHPVSCLFRILPRKFHSISGHSITSSSEAQSVRVYLSRGRHHARGTSGAYDWSRAAPTSSVTTDSPNPGSEHLLELLAARRCERQRSSFCGQRAL